MIRPIVPKSMPSPESPFNWVVVDDRYAYLSGIVAADVPEGREVLGDVEKETRVVLNTIGNILKEIGADISSIVRVDIHLSNFDDFDSMDYAYSLFFKESHYPARTTTESPRLYGDSKVEITCIARLPD